MDITLRQLEYFVAVAERLSFRAAAEACFVTQPGLSIQLKELEGQLDVQLFERSRRRVLITPEGRRCCPRCCQPPAGSPGTRILMHEDFTHRLLALVVEGKLEPLLSGACPRTMNVGGAVYCLSTQSLNVPFEQS